MKRKHLTICLVIFAMLVLLTACSRECTHENTGYTNAFGATCTSVGYSGDKQCNDCGEIIELGKETPMTEHIAITVNATEASCQKEGYTGDVVCEICQAMIEEGCVIDTIEHITSIKGAKEANCIEAGYTGDSICSACSTIVEKGSVIDSLPHDTYLKDATQATCTTAGYSGDTYCRTCNELISKGSEISPAGHFPINQNYKNATCESDGYTGDTVCNICNTLISRGEAIPATGHYPVIRGEIASTSTKEGYSGDTVCMNCDMLIKKGESVAMLPNVGSIPSIGSVEQMILNDMNSARAELGLGSLTFDTAIHPATDIRANEYKYWSNEGNHRGDPHHRPNDQEYYTTFAEIGIVDGSGITAYASHGEILAASSDAETLFNAWMNSPSHKDAILNPAYTYVSISVIFYENMYYACAIFHD